MKNIKEIKKLIDENKSFLEDKYNIKDIGIFGSYAQKNPRGDSDIDVLVEFSKPLDIFEFIRLEEFLTNLLKIKVDLVSKRALKSLIKDKILENTIYI